MLTVILGALGLGGVGAALFLFPALRALLGGVARAIPPKGWAIIAAVLVLLAGAWWVNRRIDAADAAGYARATRDRDAAWAAAFDTAHAKGLDYRAKFEQRSRELADAIRSKTDETLRRNAVAADDLRLRGPGAAAAPVCRSGGGAGAGPAARGPRPPGGPGDAPVAPVPDGEPLAILPWADVTRFAEQHDRYRAERNALIEHADAQAAALEELRTKLQAALDAARPEFGGAEAQSQRIRE